MSSMADIVFLLLIFFMLTTAFATKKGIEIQLPETESSETIAPKNIIIRIDSEGDVYLDGEKSALTDVGPYILSQRSQHSERGVILESDGSVEYQHVMDVLDELLLVGVTDISLPTRQEEEEEEKEEENPE
jgi:biopolymer transport protein ExbD